MSPSLRTSPELDSTIASLGRQSDAISLSRTFRFVGGFPDSTDRAMVDCSVRSSMMKSTSPSLLLSV